LLDQAEQRLVLARRKNRSEPLRRHRMDCLMVNCRHASPPADRDCGRSPSRARRALRFPGLRRCRG
jgi:hypothetical protein